MYKAQNVDTDKALEAIEKARRFQRAESEARIREERSYIKGIERGLDIAESMFNCSNYEKTAAGKWIVAKDTTSVTYRCPVCSFELTLADPEEKLEYKGCPMCLSMLKEGAENA